MILKELNIRAFGKFHDRRFEFGSGLNIIYGGNEAGKSTMHSFLRAMLFGMERARGRAARTDFFSRYEPWAGDGAYGGSLKAEHEGRLYRIERNFARNPLDLRITDETAGRELCDPDAFLRGLLGSLSETAFSNTVSICQLKNATDAGMVDELKNYIANMNTTGNRALNISKASAYLRTQRRQLEQRILPDAARNYAQKLSEIRKTEEELSSPAYRNRMSELTEAHVQTADIQASLQNKKEELLQKLSARRQSLRERQFESRTELLDYKRTVESAAAALEEAERKAGARAADLLSPLFAALSVILLLAAILSFDRLPEVYTPFALSPASILTGASSLSALIAISIFRGVSSRKKRRREARESFLSLIRAHFSDILGDGPAQPERDELLRSVLERSAALQEVCDSIDRGERTLGEINDKLALLKERQTETDASIVLQQKTQWALEQQLEQLSHLRDESAALKNIVDENDRLRAEIEAIDVARETMTRLAGTIRDSFGLYLNRAASELISGITGGIYSSLSIDQSLNISLNTPDKLIPLEQVSAGTMDQLYLALRLAAAELMQRDGAPLPFLFDDSFVNYDEERLRTVLEWLPRAFPERQALIFSCHRREAQLLSASLTEYRLIEL